MPDVSGLQMLLLSWAGSQHHCTRPAASALALNPRPQSPQELPFSAHLNFPHQQKCKWPTFIKRTGEVQTEEASSNEAIQINTSFYRVSAALPSGYILIQADTAAFKTESLTLAAGVTRVA